MNKKLTQSDKDWINGYFVGEASGQISMIEEIIKLLKKKRKKLKRKEFEK